MKGDDENGPVASRRLRLRSIEAEGYEVLPFGGTVVAARCGLLFADSALNQNLSMTTYRALSSRDEGDTITGLD